MNDVVTISPKSTVSDTCDVLVVGLGPIGAVLTALLSMKGLRVIAIDREADIYPLPRAGAFDSEAMRVFQMIGLADEVQPLCRVLEGYQLLSASMETLVEFRMPAGIGPYGWDGTYAFHQPNVERALRSRIAVLGGDVRLSTRLMSYTEDVSGVTAQVSGPGGIRSIAAKYIVGCDGANSQVRDLIGAGVSNYRFSEYWLVVDATLENADGLPQTPVVICDPARPTMLSQMTGARYRWEFMLRPDDDPENFASDETLARLLAPWNREDRIKVERRAIYRFQALVADQWRSGRALVAGDAAHLMPPFLGQGMCSGIRDACNLAWKIAAVLDGEASETLLDTYQHERESHVRSIIERSMDLGKMICIIDPAMAARRNAGMLAMKAAGQVPPMLPLPPLSGRGFMGGRDSGDLFIQPVVAGRRLDDVLNHGAWLITHKAATRALGKVRQFVLASEEAASFRPPLQRWLDERLAEAVLVRPDRHIFGIGDPDDLLTAWRNSISALPVQ